MTPGGEDRFPESALLVGGGSSDPRVWLLREGSGGPEAVLDMRPEGVSASIYALAISPSHTWAAVATRPIHDPNTGQLLVPSLVRVEPTSTLLRKDPPGGPAGVPGARSWEVAGVLDLIVDDGGSVVLARGDGSLARLRREAGPPAALTIEREDPLHQGFVFSVADLGEDRLASFGADGLVSITDRESGARLARAGPFPVPGLRDRCAALIHLGAGVAAGRLFFGDAEGNLHEVDFDGGTRSASTHRGDCLAVCWHPEAEVVVTGGLGDSRLCRVNPETLSVLDEAPAGGPVRGLVALPEKKIAVLDGGGGVTLWSLAGGLERLRVLGRIDARSWAGPNVAARAAAGRQLTTSRREAAISRARSALERGALEEARESIGELRGLGFAGDVEILEAMLARREGRLLDELAFWRDLGGPGRGGLEPAESYLAAENLELLGEREAAAEAFRELKDYRDAGTRAEALEAHPLFGLDRQHVVRGDLAAPEQMLAEIDKEALLDRAFAGRAVLRSNIPSMSLPAEPPLKDVIRGLRSSTKEEGLVGEIVAESRSLVVVGRREVEWLRVTRPGFHPAGDLEMALEVRSGATGPKAILYALFAVQAPDSDVEVGEWNREVAERWTEVWSGAAGKEWIKRVTRDVWEAAVSVANRRRAATTSGRRSTRSRR